jgi:hypothetical protein
MGLRRSGLVSLAVPMAVLALVACSSGDPGHAPYLRQSTVACPAVDALAPQRSTDPLPADFRPVSAVRCTFRLGFGQATASPSGGIEWAAAQRSTGPFGDLVRALRLPPPRQRGGTRACTAIFILPTLVALTDASGRTLAPAMPGTECGSPVPEVGSALDALTWVEIAHAR